VRVAVVPSRDGGPRLQRALAALNGLPAIVVDDSVAGLPELRAPPAGVEVRRAGGWGFARATNLGLQAAAAGGAREALLLNDDAAPLPGCLPALFGRLRAGVGAVGPVLVDEAGRVESAGFHVSAWGRVRSLLDTPADDRPVAAASAACLLISAHRRLDEGYPHGMEDLALCAGLRAEGLAVIVTPAARCLHTGGATLDRRSAEATRAAVMGHLRLVGGGARAPVVIGLAAAQVLREGRPAHLSAVWQGWRAARAGP
jgi:GT2 family glycosyltransferase